MATTTLNPASDKQVDYIKTLLGQREVPDSVRDIATQPYLTSRQASACIDLLRALPYLPKAKPAARAVAVTEVGVYLKDGVVYRVKESKSSGRLYAETLSGTAWSYDRQHIYALAPEDKMTLEQAKEYGVLTGVCAICGATLTDPKSIRFGIGPVCVKRFR